MKRFWLGLSILILLSTKIISQKESDVLMTVGSSAVTVGEFKYIYEKNNGDKADYSSKSLQEYLDLYTNFKLKVEKAKQLKLDTIQDLKDELLGYRKQLAGSYLIDKEVTESLLKELYERTKYDVEFSHIFIPISAADNASKKEELKSQMMAIQSKIIAGQKFEEVAKEFSKDPNSAGKGGYMGYMTAKLPNGFYDLESALYNTEIQKVSDIVESKIGYHLVKVLNKRPARGQIHVAHIFIKSDKKNGQQLTDSLYNRIMAGEEFSHLAALFSDDKNTNNGGGILPPFGINTYDNDFENQAFSLQNDNEVTKPFQSKSGWHIIKRLTKTTPDSYEIFVRKMKPQINKDERFNTAKLALIKDIKSSNGFTENLNVLEGFIATLGDDFYSYKWNPESEKQDEMLFTLGNKTSYTLSDFTQFVKKNTKTRLKYDKGRPLSLTAHELYDEFVNEKAIEFEEIHLEYKYPDFKSLMREYEEGILLFEVTKMKVWDKANADTTGLVKFYESHKMKYIGEEKCTASNFVIQSMDMDFVNKVYKYAAGKPTEKVLAKFNKGGQFIMVIDETYEKSNAAIKGVDWKKGALTPLVANSQAKHYSFKKIKEIIPSQVKSLSDARGYVVADYQDFLEKQWVAELKKEFLTIINQPVFQSLIK